MANSKYTIDEDLLREKMLAYSVNFDPACLSALENEVAQVKTHAHIELPDRKNIIRLSIIVSGILVLAGIVFFVTQAIQNHKEEPQTKIETAPPVIENIQPQTPSTPTVAVIDTLKAEPKKVDSIAAPPQTKTVTNNQTPVVKQQEKNTKQVVVQQVDTVKKKIKADTSATKNTTAQPTKKKKKRKNVLDATQDIRDAAPSSADDDVVIPNN